MSEYRITITGSSGVGKTTLAGELAASLNLPLLPELARELCIELGYEKIGSIPDQEGFKKQVLARQIEKEAASGSFVCDRGALDCWVLWQRWNICSAMTYDTEFIYECVAKHCKTYTHIIYVPPLFQPKEDGFRWIEKDYIKQVDRLVRMSLNELSLMDRVYTIRSEGIEKRLAEVLEFLKEEKTRC